MLSCQAPLELGLAHVIQCPVATLRFFPFLHFQPLAARTSLTFLIFFLFFSFPFLGIAYPARYAVRPSNSFGLGAVGPLP